MKKRILITATELNLVQFWVCHIENLIRNGYSVDIVCSHVGGKLKELQEALSSFENLRITIVDLKRSPLSPHNVRGFIQMKNYLKKNKYDFIITNEPVMGMVTRFASVSLRKSGTKVIYFAHGFHFWKGAPILNWLLFFPMEKIASYFTDVIVTMNREDYLLAKKTFGSASIKYIHGIGIDLSKFDFSNALRTKKREQLGVLDDEIMIFSANELTNRKNVMFALQVINTLVLKGYRNVKYFVRGQGPLEKQMQNYIKANKLEQNVCLLGYGKDILEMDCASDIFLFTSKQEGLPVAVMEAMSCQLPCVVSDIRGVTDLIENGKGGYVCKLCHINDFVQSIEKIIKNKEKENLTKNNKNTLKLYDRSSVFSDIYGILQEFEI